MPYPAAAIANEFLKLARDESESLTPMQLLKLVYFAHGWSLALTGQPLIDEQVQAWQYGPVIASLYHQLKRFGGGPVTESIRLPEMFPRLGYRRVQIDHGSNAEENYRAKQIVKRVWQQYGHLTGVQLSNLTHLPDGPWANTPDKGKRDTFVPDSSIKRYFQRVAEGGENERSRH